MPTILITTSRRTSNRVRAFARDLATVLPGSHRFNRGGMSIDELVSRILQDDAKAALVISSFRGNPGTIQFLSADGSIEYELNIESAILRREIGTDTKNRINNLSFIGLMQTSNRVLNQFSQYLSSLLSIPVRVVQDATELPLGTSTQAYLLLKESGKKIHWSWHLAANQKELGPRIRIIKLRSKSDVS